MRLAVDHRTVYRFTEPQARVVQLLRLTPADTDQQTIADWRILVGCDARLRPARDGFGNVATMLYAEGPLDHIEIAVTGEVLTVPGSGIVSGAVEPFPPLLYTRTTPLTEGDADIAAFAHQAAVGHAALDRLHALNRAIHDRFPLDGGRPVAGRTARATFDTGHATARDLAHLFIAAAHALGQPARYVSGYSLIAARGETQPTPHGWAEAWVEGLGWVGFDPGLGLCAAEEYVRVAIGLDAAGAAPVAGSRLGDGAERLEVGVTVDAVRED
ncbi:transglutaminase family protein [Sphingomonas sp. GlSt437]|uniref:transglutaminase family protein n=1 Tax=Sphingomonas sp. GlSt437 TaxID=3389970 RepID=UPI003A8AB218